MPPSEASTLGPDNNFLRVNPGNYNRRARRRRRRDEKENFPWNKYKNTPSIETEARPFEESNLYQWFIKILKILTYLVTFVLTLGSTVLAKSMILLMTSQIRPNTHRPYCHYDERRRLEVEISLLERIQWTWALLFCFLIPEIFTFFSSLRITIFKVNRTKANDKDHPRLNLVQFLVPCTFEILHVIGLALLTFCILPSEHVINGAMLSNSVCLIPAILHLLCRLKLKIIYTQSYILLRLVDGFAIISQILCFVIWPFHATSSKFAWLFPPAAILTSFGWWENYVSKESDFVFIRKLAELRTQLMKTRHQCYLYISVLKITTFFCTMCLSIWIIGDDLFDYFNHFGASFNSHPLQVGHVGDTLANGVTLPSSILPVDGVIQESFKIDSHDSSTVYIILIQFLAAYLCSICAKFACRICIQQFSFALPLNLSVPVTIAFLTTMCGMRGENVCVARDILPPYMFWICPNGQFDTDFLVGDHGWGWIFLVLSQTWIVLHVWYPRANLLRPNEILFRRPMGYNSILTDQDLLMNRKRQDNNDLDEDDDLEKDKDENVVQVDANPIHARLDRTTRIKACATMWHESKDEMLSMLKSINRLDKDQGSRPLDDPDYYELEVHIFFDDAFAYHDKKNKKPPYLINEWVKWFIEAVDLACKRIHKDGRLKPFKKISTPYGGRLEWTLPCGTKLLVHLKNKNRIRHKKRWSQVMYMYYLLAHQIGDVGLSKERQKMISNNTFLLALDGDIDFQPEAVKLLVHRMKFNEKLGAACGRIHPIGRGLMVWFQKFEYAIGHWLQKATEHMIGCVLCAPGCFSLFRASALMDDGVMNAAMNAYAKKSEKARHYVQYDQGEDRWLCTLLLQRGWRIDYCAASNALTHSPGGFDEFFVQRRRWIPSTMANIMDLLRSYKHTVKINPDISSIYIFYQLVMMIGSILGPGTIFLMLVGSFVAAFKIDNYKSFYINFAPLILFMVICYFCKAKTQLAFAKILSALYALIMVAVLIALILQMYDDGLLAPSSIFLLGITTSFVIAALAHPQEISCLFHGFVYFLTIPSMYLLLIIFSLFNLNDVSWGTRDDGTDKEKNQQNGGGSSIQNALQGIISTGGPAGDANNNSDYTEATFQINLGALCQFYCCLLPGQDHQILERRRAAREAAASAVGAAASNEPPTKRKERPWIWNKVPIWFGEAECMKHAEVDFVTRTEAIFWLQLIKTYLTPIPELTKKEEDDRKKALLKLRNEMVGAFFMLNAVFVTALFLMQLNKDKLFVTWPLAGTHVLIYQREHVRVTVDTDFLHLEALGLLFVGFYAIILTVQFLGMLCHRFETFSIIMATTSILPLWRTKSGKKESDDADTAVEMTQVFVVETVESSSSEYESEGESNDETLWEIDTRAQFYRETMETPVQTIEQEVPAQALMRRRPSIVFAIGPNNGGLGQNINIDGEDVLPPYTI